MACTVDYAFYANDWGGTLGEAFFDEQLPVALSHLRWLCAGREPAEQHERAYRRALCAAVDAFAEHGSGEVGGYALGDYRVTNYQDRSPVGADLATLAALKELFDSGMTFAGVR